MFPPLLFYIQFADCGSPSHRLSTYHAFLLNCCCEQGSVLCIFHIRVCLTFILSLRQAVLAVVAVASCLFCQASLSQSVLQLHPAQQPFSSLF